MYVHVAYLMKIAIFTNNMYVDRKNIYYFDIEKNINTLGIHMLHFEHGNQKQL